MQRRQGRYLLLAAAAAGLVACSGSPASPARSTSAPATAPSASVPEQPTPSGSGTTLDAADWPTFGHDAGRTGVAPGFPTVAKPSIAWRKNLDGAVYGQPIVVGDTVFAATENDTVYALAAADGAVRWSKHVGMPVALHDLPCGNIDPLGITGTMAYDPSTRSVFAVAETAGGHHTLYGFDASAGTVTQRRDVEPPKGDPIAHQQRSALTVLGGRVYIAYGGLTGDCAQYIGSVVGAPTRGAGANISYAIPTTREGGIWAPGGGVATGSGASARLLYAAGNGESTSGYDGSDSVIALNSDLKLVDRFSPRTWAEDNAQDLDLGSMTPAPVGGFVYTNGKRGTGYVLRGTHFGGIGGNVAQADVCPAYGAAAVSGTTVYVPCADGGTKAVSIGANGKIATLWQANVSTNGSPMIGGGSIWVTDWNAGTLYLLDPATGKSHAQVHLGDLPHFASPSLAHGQAYVGTMSGVVAIK
jgi:outer membrane protein assembly factor BamB